MGQFLCSGVLQAISSSRYVWSVCVFTIIECNNPQFHSIVCTKTLPWGNPYNARRHPWTLVLFVFSAIGRNSQTNNIELSSLGQIHQVREMQLQLAISASKSAPHPLIAGWWRKLGRLWFSYLYNTVMEEKRLPNGSSPSSNWRNEKQLQH